MIGELIMPALAVGVGGVYWAHARGEGVSRLPLHVLAGAMVGYVFVALSMHGLGWGAAWRVGLACAWLALGWVDYARRTVHDWAILPLGAFAALSLPLRGGDGMVLALGVMVALASALVLRWSRGGVGLGDVIALPIAVLSLGDMQRVPVLIAALLVAEVWARADRERGAPLLAPLGVAVALGVLM